MKHLSKLFLVTLLAVNLASLGCGTIEEDMGEEAIRDAIPSTSEILIDFPEEAEIEGDTLYATAEDDLAMFYLITRQVIDDANWYVHAMLTAVDTIVSYPASSHPYTNTWVWGPWTDGLTPAEYRFVGVLNVDNSVDYYLQMRDKDETLWQTVMAGDVNAGYSARRGIGSFAIDYDIIFSIDPAMDIEGQVLVSYDTLSPTNSIQINLNEFRGERDSEYHDGEYIYTSNSDGSGTFDFGFEDNLDATPSDAMEFYLIRSRWISDGDGRSDAVLGGGDLGNASVVFAECWDDDFETVYYHDSHGLLPDEGDPADCVFADSSLP